MEESKKQLILLCTFVVIVLIGVVLYKSDRFWNLGKWLPLHTNSGNCVKISDNICLAEDAGLRLNYYEASSLCSKRGMRLPTIEDTWFIWTNSENCHRTFASNLIVPKSKQDFINVCYDDNCIDSANNINKYCSDNSLIKFPIASQYEKGSFWIKDSASEGNHYAINYSTGKVRAFPDDYKNLGVRCVSK